MLEWVQFRPCLAILPGYPAVEKKGGGDTGAIYLTHVVLLAAYVICVYKDGKNPEKLADSL